MAYRRGGVAGWICGVLVFVSLVCVSRAQGQSLHWERRTPGGQWPHWAVGLFADPTADRLVAFGIGRPSPDVAISFWDEASATWTPLARPPSATWPADRKLPAMARHDHRPVVFMFGGMESSPPTQSLMGFNDLWEWSFEDHTWTLLDAGGQVPRLAAAAMTYDAARDVLMLFGGLTLPLASWTTELWEWSFATRVWTRVEAPAGATWPPRIEQPDMVFDPFRSRTVLTGSGSASIVGGQSRRVWEWDGTGWTINTAPPLSIVPVGPSPFFTTRLVFDRAGQRTLLLGTDIDSIALSLHGVRLWEWLPADGVWATIPAPVAPLSPPAETQFSMGPSLAFDQRRQRLAVFGGLNKRADNNDLVEFDLASSTWRNRTPTWIVNGFASAIAYDPIRRVAVLFGGTSWTDYAVTAATFEWDGNTGSWRDRTPTALERSWPLPRAKSAMVFDSIHGGALMFGGSVAPGEINDLWLWNGELGQWSEISRVDAAVPWPSARTEHAMAWDSGRNVLVVHGGLGNPGLLDDTWEWDPATSVWSNRSTAPSPGGRAGHSMYYDVARQRTVLFGGQAGADVDAAVWEWNGAAGTWTKTGGPPTTWQAWPRARQHHVMVYDSSRKVGLLIGGMGGGFNGIAEPLSDAWEWNGETATFVDRTPPVHPDAWPQPRVLAAMTYDSDRRRFILVGGEVDKQIESQTNLLRAPVLEASWTPEAPGAGCGCDSAGSGGTSSALGLMMLLVLVRRSRRPRSRFAGLICGVLAFGALISAAHAQKLSLNWERRMPDGQWPEDMFGAFVDPTADRLVVFGRGLSSEVAIWTWDDGAARWTLQAPASSLPRPTNRSRATMARDSRRPVAFMFGGLQNIGPYQNSTLSELWEWSFESQSWTRVDASSARHPPPRAYPAMAFDESRGVLVMYGADSIWGGGWMKDLWEWNPGTGTWTEIPDPHVGLWPPALARPDMAFDPSRSRIVMVGTDLFEADRGRQVWEWDGTTWTVATSEPTAAAPLPSLAARLVFDPTRTRMLALGIEGDLFTRVENSLRLWEWHAAEGTWAVLPLDSAPSPIPSTYIAPEYVAFDPRHDRILSIGGMIGATQVNDLLELDLAAGTWRNRTPVWTITPQDADAAYDPTRRVTVLFGGSTTEGGSTASTLEWDGNTGSWRDRTPAVLPLAWPFARTGSAMAYDTLHEGALLFGGAPFGPINDFWIWRGDSGQWSEISRDDAGVPWPGARSGHAMAWDRARNVLVLFGGSGPVQNLRLADTWEWDGATSVWTNRTVTPSPGARSGHSMYYDAGRQRTVLFGGSNETGDYADLWEWNGEAGTWTKVNLPTFAAVLPRGRSDHAMVFDSDRNTGLLFGGSSNTIISPNFLSDVWEWDGGTATFVDQSRSNRSGATWPPSRTSPAMVYDSDRKRLVLIGGFPDVSADPIQSIRAPVWEASWGPAIDVPAGGGCGCAAAASGGPSPGVVLLMLLAIGFCRRRARFVGAACGALVLGCLVAGAHAQEQSITWERRMPGGEWPEKAFGLFTDPTSDRQVVFGQGPGGEVAIWIWDEAGARWTRQPQPPSASWPASRAGATMARDSRRPVVYMFGGLQNPSAAESFSFDDLWEWSFESQSWTPVDGASTNRPVGRSYAGMAFDDRRGVLVLFGGDYINGTWRSDLLEWNPGTGTWNQIIQVPPEAGGLWPPDLEWPDMAFDPSRSRMVLVGASPVGGTDRQVWEWDGTAWTAGASQGPDAGPVPWLPVRLLFDPTRARMLALGTEFGTQMQMRLWEWRPVEDAWTLLPFDPMPSPARSTVVDWRPGYLAHDARRDRIVTFGGAMGTMSQINDLLELDLAASAWRNRTPVWCDNRCDASAVYDPIRRVTVVFGGFTFSNGLPTASTFEWDGSTGTWRDRTPTGTPMAWPLDRAKTAMVYDTLHERTLMFGGGTGVGVPINDFWSWNGDAGVWTEISRDDAAVPWPGARADHAMAWDQARNVLVVHGGGGSQEPLADTWEWDGATSVWAKRDDAPSPDARAAHTMYYDAIRRRTVRFGGRSQTDSDREVWDWNGDAGVWTQANQAAMLVDRPSGRSDHVMVFDPDRNTGLLFGGWSSNVLTNMGGALSDAWEWDGRSATFVDRTPSSRPPETWPSPRTLATLSYDSDRKRLVLIGGYPDPSVNPLDSIRAPVWEGSWGPSKDGPADGGCGCAAGASGGPSPGVVLLMLLAIGFRSRRARGARAIGVVLVFASLIAGGRAQGQALTWERRMPGGGHWPELVFGLFADPTADRLVAFGNGVVAPEVAVSIWDEASARWTRLARPPSAPWPADRWTPLMARDGRRGVVFMFGGSRSSDGSVTGSFQELWEWSFQDQSWTLLDQGSGPRPTVTLGGGMAFDENRQVLVLFGGQDPFGGFFTSDHWEWDPATQRWREIVAATSPPPLGQVEMTYDPSRSRIVLIGSLNYMQSFVSQVWEWDGTTWTVGPATEPSRTADGPASVVPTRLLFDSVGGRMLAFGMEFDPDNQVPGNLWVWERRWAEGVWTKLPLPFVPPVSLLDGSLVSPGYAAYDPRHHRVAVIGGFVGATDSNDLIEVDLATAAWRNRTPAWPVNQFAANAVYDPNRRVTIVFGGARWTDTTPSADLLEWNGDSGTWRDRTPSPRPAAWPIARGVSALAYDGTRRRVLMFGGAIEGGPINDLWAWDGDSGRWLEITRDDAAIPWPIARGGHGMAWDSTREVLVVQGGSSSQTVLGDTWEWDGRTSVWTNRTLPKAPGPHAGHTLYYDAGRQRTILFGGVDENGNVDGSVWEWNGTAGTWAKIRGPFSGPGPAPGPRHSHVMVYGGARKGLVFGGSTPLGEPLFDAWEWDSENWSFMDRTPTVRSPQSWPPARQQAAMAYDTDRKRLVLIGGNLNMQVVSVFDSLRAPVWEAPWSPAGPPDPTPGSGADGGVDAGPGSDGDAGCGCAAAPGGKASAAVGLVMLLAISFRSRCGSCRSRPHRSRRRSRAPRPDSCSSRHASP